MFLYVRLSVYYVDDFSHSSTNPSRQYKYNDRGKISIRTTAGISPKWVCVKREEGAECATRGISVFYFCSGVPIQKDIVLSPPCICDSFNRSQQESYKRGEKTNRLERNVRPSY